MQKLLKLMLFSSIMCLQAQAAIQINKNSKKQMEKLASVLNANNGRVFEVKSANYGTNEQNLDVRGWIENFAKDGVLFIPSNMNEAFNNTSNNKNRLLIECSFKNTEGIVNEHKLIINQNYNEGDNWQSHFIKNLECLFYIKQ